MTKKKMQLPLTCETHVHDGYGPSKDTPCPWCEIERLRNDIQELTCGDRTLVSSATEPSARLTEATFQAKEGEPLQATAQFQGDAVKEWALVMVQWFREKGGINYVACDLRDPTTGEAYEIVMQKAGGRTPAQDLAEMRAQLNRGEKP